MEAIFDTSTRKLFRPSHKCGRARHFTVHDWPLRRSYEALCARDACYAVSSQVLGQAVDDESDPKMHH